MSYKELLEFLAAAAGGAGAVWGFAMRLNSREQKLREEMRKMVATAHNTMQDALNRHEDRDEDMFQELRRGLGHKADKEDLQAIGKVIDGFRTQMWDVIGKIGAGK